MRAGAIGYRCYPLSGDRTDLLAELPVRRHLMQNRTTEENRLEIAQAKSIRPNIRVDKEWLLLVFYQRLFAKGKARKVALASVVRRLLTAASPIIRDQKPWQDPEKEP